VVIFLLLLFFCCFIFIKLTSRVNHSSLCRTIMANDNRYYNICVLPARHEGVCMTVEGVKFLNDK
jgi:hypothetical protein